MGSYHEQEEAERMTEEMGDLIWRIVHVAMLLGGIALSIFMAGQAARITYGG